MMNFLRVLSGFVLLVLFGGAWTWFELRSAPAWYSPPDPNGAGIADVAALAERVEYGLIESFHKIRETDEPWAIEIEEDHINAWLATRLNDWLEHDREMSWPAELSAPQVNFGEKGIELAMSVKPPGMRGRPQVVVSRLAPRVENGRVGFELDRVGLGRVSVPGAPAGRLASWVGEQVGQGPAGTPAGADAQGEALVQRVLSSMSDGRALDSMLELADGRRIEVLDLTMTDGQLQLTNVTRAAEN